MRNIDGSQSRYRPNFALIIQTQAEIDCTHKSQTKASYHGAFLLLGLGGIAEIVLHPLLQHKGKEKPCILANTGFFIFWGS